MNQPITKREMSIIVGFLLLPIFIIGIVATIGFIIGLLPREDTRQLRRKLAEFVMWQWVRGSRLSSIVYQWLWSKGNGS